MFKFDDELFKWGNWARGGEVSLSASNWEYTEKQKGVASELNSFELEQKIEKAVAVVHRVDALAANVVRQYYVHAKPKETQQAMANEMQISLSQFKNKLRKGRIRVALQVFNNTGF